MLKEVRLYNHIKNLYNEEVEMQASEEGEYERRMQGLRADHGSGTYGSKGDRKRSSRILCQCGYLFPCYHHQVGGDRGVGARLLYGYQGERDSQKTRRVGRRGRKRPQVQKRGCLGTRLSYIGRRRKSLA